MSIEFRCSACDQLLRTGDDTAGKKTRCPSCGEIMGVPSASTTGELGSAEQGSGAESQTPGSLFADQGAASGGIRDPYSTPDTSGESNNPYQTPSPVEKPVKEKIDEGVDEFSLGPQNIQFGPTFSRAWEMCTNDITPVLLFGLIVFGVSIGINFATQIIFVPANIAIQVAGNEITLVIISQIIQYIVSIFAQSFITLLSINFGLAFIRQHDAPLDKVFINIGPKIFPLFGFQIILMLIILATAVVAFGVPVAFAISEVPIGVLISVITLSIPGIIFIVYTGLRYMLTNYLIVDQDMSVLDAMKRSSQLMGGHKMTSLLIML